MYDYFIVYFQELRFLKYWINVILRIFHVQNIMSKTIQKDNTEKVAISCVKVTVSSVKVAMLVRQYNTEKVAVSSANVALLLRAQT